MKFAGRDSILVIKPSSLGDVIHTIPAVVALHRARPESEIRWIVNPEWSPLLEGLSFLEEVIPFRRKEFRGLGGWLKARRWARDNLRPLEPDICFDFQGLFRSGWLAAQSKARQVVGFSRSRECASLFYDLKVAVPHWEKTHAVNRYGHLVDVCGADFDKDGEFLLPPGKPVDSSLLPSDSGWILLHPFSRGAGKSLRQSEVVEFCRLVAPRPVVIAGAGATIDSRLLPGNAFNLLDKTSLSELIYLIRKADWTVSVDSGPMHLAAAITNRVVSIHTWSDPAIVGPWPAETWIYRDGHLLKTGSIQPGQFPEDRSSREEYGAAERLIPATALEKIASLVCGDSA